MKKIFFALLFFVCVSAFAQVRYIDTTATGVEVSKYVSTKEGAEHGRLPVATESTLGPKYSSTYSNMLLDTLGVYWENVGTLFADTSAIVAFYIQNHDTSALVHITNDTTGGYWIIDHLNMFRDQISWADSTVDLWVRGSTTSTIVNMLYAK